MSCPVLIVDDEPLAVEMLEGECARDPRIQVVGTTTDGTAVLDMVARLNPAALFLDIGMPGLGGLAVAAGLRTLAAPPLIVFVTAYDNFAAEAFDLAVTDYLLKPVTSERFRRTVDRITDQFEQRRWASTAQADDLWLPRRGTMVRVPIAAITRIEADRDYLKIFTAEDSFLLRGTMNAMAERLPSARFVRIHRSMIVATGHVAECRHMGNGAWAVMDQKGRVCPIGRAYLPEVRRSLGLTAFAP